MHKAIDSYEADAALKGILARGRDIQTQLSEGSDLDGVEDAVLNLLTRIKAASKTITGDDRYKYGALEWRGQASVKLMIDVFESAWAPGDEGFVLPVGERRVWFSDRGEDWTWKVVAEAPTSSQV